MGIELAGKVGGDLLLATDPDADRLGGATRNGDGYAFLTGNEFAAILARYRLDALDAAGRLPKRPLGIKTEVTTDLIRRLIESRNGVVVGDLLVGFKYVAAVLGSLERTGQYRDVRASLDDFVLAAEESHGFMLTPEVRDKDAAGAAVVLAELTSELAERGETVYDYLVDTYKRYGYHANTVRSTVMQGASGSANIRKIQQLLRSDPPKVIGGRGVLGINDYWDESKYGPFLSETDKSSRNLISYTVEGGIKATIRPSGTEPKNKLYLELAAAPLGPDASQAEFNEHRQAVDREVKEFSNKFLAQMLDLIGVAVPSMHLRFPISCPCSTRWTSANGSCRSFGGAPKRSRRTPIRSGISARGSTRPCDRTAGCPHLGAASLPSVCRDMCRVQCTRGAATSVCRRVADREHGDTRYAELAQERKLQ